MTNEQYQEVLLGLETAVRAIANSPDFKRLQESEHFHTSNDLVLEDAIQSLYEVRGGLQRVAEHSVRFDLNYKYHARMPRLHGEYYFQLADGSRNWGLYSNFAYPNHHHIRIANSEEPQFYYLDHKEVAGYFESH